MKKLILILISFVILVSCELKHNHRPVITSKNLISNREKQKIGLDWEYIYVTDKYLCKYYYSGLGYSNIDFVDSCCKYNIGDTIHVSN